MEAVAMLALRFPAGRKPSPQIAPRSFWMNIDVQNKRTSDR
jgi:hypothetical protein